MLNHPYWLVTYGYGYQRDTARRSYHTVATDQQPLDFLQKLQEDAQALGEQNYFTEFHLLFALPISQAQYLTHKDPDGSEEADE